MNLDSFEVRNEKAEKMLKEIGEWLKEACPPGFGFSLLIFSWGGGYDKKGNPLGSMFYTSNAERETMIAAMKEFIAKHEPN